MMFPRYFFSLCALFFFAAIVCAEVQVKESSQNVIAIDEVETRNPLLLRAAMKIIQAAVKWAAKNCVKDAANNCKQHWKNPKALVTCGKNYLQANKGRCASG